MPDNSADVSQNLHNFFWAKFLKASSFLFSSGSVSVNFAGMDQGESMSAQFLFAAVIPAKITCSR